MATEKDLIISDKKTVADQELEARTTEIAEAAPFNIDLYNADMGDEDGDTDITDDIETNFTPVDTSGEEIHSDNYYTEKFKNDLGFGVGKDTKMSTPILGLYDKLNIFSKDYKGKYAPEELKGQFRLRNALGDLARIVDRTAISGVTGINNTLNDMVRMDMPGFMAEMLTGDVVGANVLAMKAIKAGIDKKSLPEFFKKLGDINNRMSMADAMGTGLISKNIFQDIADNKDPFQVKDDPDFEPMSGQDRLAGENWGLLGGKGASFDELVGGFPVIDTGRPLADMGSTFAGEVAPFFLTFAAAKALTPGLPDEYVYAANVFNKAKAASPQFAKAISWMKVNMPRVSKVSKFIAKNSVEGARNSLIAETILGDPYQPSLMDNLLPEGINNNARLNDSFVEAKIKSLFVNEIINGIPMGVAFGAGGKALNLTRKFGQGGFKGAFPGQFPTKNTQLDLLDKSIGTKTAEDYGYQIAENYLRSIVDAAEARVIKPMVNYLSKWKIFEAAIDNADNLKKEYDAIEYYKKIRAKLDADEKTKGNQENTIEAETIEEQQTPQPKRALDGKVRQPIRIGEVDEDAPGKDLLTYYKNRGDIESPRWETGYTEQKQVDLEAEVKKSQNIVKKAAKELGKATEEFVAEQKIQSQIRPDSDRGFSNELGTSVGLAAPTAGEVAKVKVSDLTVRPDVFQVKSEGKYNKKGVSGSLKEASSFDPNLADLLTVWRDTTGEIGDVGKVYIVDGHNRLDLAQRSGVGEVDVRFVDVATVEEAQTISALKNIAQGTSIKGSMTAMDVALFMQNSGETLESLAQKGITLTNTLMIEGTQLSRLPRNILDKVATKEIPYNKALALGSVEGASVESINFVYSKFVKNPKYSADRIRQIMLASTRAVETVTEGTLPGLEQWSKENNLPEISAIAEAFLKTLRTEISGLRAITQKNKKEAIEKVKGNKIAYDDSVDKRLEAERQVERFEGLAYTVSDTNRLINELASQMKANKISVNQIIKNNFETIKSAMAGDDAPLTKIESEPARVQKEVDAKLNEKANDLLRNEKPEPINREEVQKVVNKEKEELLQGYTEQEIFDIEDELVANNGSLNKNHSKIGETLKSTVTNANKKKLPISTRGGFKFKTLGDVSRVTFADMWKILKVRHPMTLRFDNEKWAGTAKPRYGKYQIEFANDIDKAIYITGNRWNKKPSAKDGEFRAFLEEVGIPSNRQYESFIKMKNQLKELAAQDPEDGVLILENSRAYEYSIEAPIATRGGKSLGNGRFTIIGNYTDERGWVRKDPRYTPDMFDKDLKKGDFELDDLREIENENVKKANEKLQAKYNKEYKDSTNPKNFDPLDPKNNEQMEFALEDDIYTNMGNDHVNADVNLTEQQAQELVDIARKIAGANVQNLRLVDAIEPKISAKAAADYGLPPSAIGRTGRAKGLFRFGSTPAKDLIVLAMTYKSHFINFGSMMQTLRHESFHRIQDRYLTLKEQKLLDSPAVDRQLREIVASFYPKHQKYLYGAKRMSEREVQAFAFSVFDELDFAKEPTWLQPFKKLQEIAEKINNKLSGYGFKTYKDIFRDAQAGRLAERTPRPFRYAKNIPGNTAPEPASFALNPDEFTENLETIKVAIRDGDMTIEEAMDGLYRRLINRKLNPDGKRYIPTSEADLIATNKAFETSLFELLGTREDATKVPSFTMENMKRLGLQLITESNFRTDEILALHKKAMRGDKNALQKQVAQAAIILQRDVQIQQMKEVALDIKLNPNDSTSKSLLISLWEDAMKVSVAIAEVNRPSAQNLRMQQMDFLGGQEMFIPPYQHIEMDVSSTKVGTTALEEGVEKAGLVQDKGLGEGTYFKSMDGGEVREKSTYVDGMTNADIMILDLTSQNKTLSKLLQELNIDGVGAVLGGKLTPEQKGALAEYLASKKYQGIRVDGREIGQPGDIIYVPDSNQANKIINSKAQIQEGSDPADIPEQQSIPGVFKRAVLEQENIFEKVMSKKDYESVMNNKPTKRAREIMEVIAESLYLYKDRTKSMNNFMTNFAKGLDNVGKGQLTQEKIAQIARNGIFLNSATLGKVLGGSLFRAFTLPYSQFMGAGKTKRKALAAGDIDGARMARIRQQLNLTMYLRYFVHAAHAFRLALSAVKHDEVFGNINRGYFEADGYRKSKNPNKQPKIRRFDDYVQEEIDDEARRMLSGGKSVAKHLTNPETNPVILATHYLTKGIKTTFGSGASRVMSGLDTLVGMTVAPSYEYARLMEQELFQKMAQGFDMHDPRIFNEAHKKAEAALNRALADVEMPDGSVIKGGFMDSVHARQAVDYVNFTDSIEVDRNERTVEYGIRRAQEKGLTQPEDILEFAEQYRNDEDLNNLEYFTKASEPTNDQFRMLGLSKNETGLDGLGQEILNYPSKRIHKATRAVPLLGVVFPTNRTPLNLVKSALRHLPLPTNRLVDSYWRDITSEDLFQRERAIGEIATSQHLFALGIGAVATGLVEFSGPTSTDFNRDKLNRYKHRPPNAVRFRTPGSNEWSDWYSMDMFDTASFIFGSIGGYVDAIKRMPRDSQFEIPFTENEEIDYSEQAQDAYIIANAHTLRRFDTWTAAKAIGDTVKENTVGYFRKSVMANVGNFYDLIQELLSTEESGNQYIHTGKRNMLETTIARYMKMPLALLRQTRIGFDNKRYLINESVNAKTGERTWYATARDLAFELLMEMPGLQNVVGTPEIDPIFGQPVEYDYAFGGNEIKNPLLRSLVMNIHPLAMFRPTKERNGIIYKELSRLHGYGAYPRFSTRTSLGIKGYVMSNQEFMEFRELMTTLKDPNGTGLTFAQDLERLLNSDAYKELPDYDPEFDVTGQPRNIVSKRAMLTKLYAIEQLAKKYRDAARRQFIRTKPYLQHLQNENKILNKEIAQTTNDFPNQVEAWRSIVNSDVRTG